jgi:spermidine synthase
MSGGLPPFERKLLLFSVFILSLCGITYELVLGSLATYLLGNPALQYSITIGVFLSSMGLGSYLSRYITNDLLRSFILIEIALGLIGGVSVLALSFIFSYTNSYYLLHIFTLITIGTLAGIEIPLITRILKQYGNLKDILSNVLTLDYIGGLAGSLLFPILLYPFVGRLLTSVLIGIANITVAIVIMIKIDYPKKRKGDLLVPLMSIALLLFLAFQSDALNALFQKQLYMDDIVFTKRSRIQEIVLTRNGDDFRLYLDGSIQFSTSDEYRYHEMLVHPACSLRPGPNLRAAVLGGGDGLAVRELLKHSRVTEIVLVELDPEIIELAVNNPSISRINGASLSDPRVKVVVTDAYLYIRDNRKPFDIIIADFPDPHDETIAKLYTVEFYRMIKRSLKPEGVFVTQSTSPLSADEAFWCVNHTMKEVFGHAVPYNIYVPSFGNWGFNLSVKGGPPEFTGVSEKVHPVRYYSKAAMEAALFFPDDLREKETSLNTFNKPVLYTYYIKGWKNYSEQ